MIPRYNDLIPLLPWHIVISGFHCSNNTDNNNNNKRGEGGGENTT